MKDNYPFTRDELDIAYHTSVIDLAQQYGYTLKDENRVYRVCGNAGLFFMERWSWLVSGFNR